MRKLEFQAEGLTKRDLRRLKLNNLPRAGSTVLRGRSSSFLWIILTAGALYLFTHTSRGTNPYILNADFEDHTIADRPSADSADVPDWAHSGSSGDGLLFRIWNTDSSSAITRAGHGSQFVTLGGGVNRPDWASWTTTIYGLTPGGLYQLSFMIANESHPDQGSDSAQTMTVRFLSGSSKSPQSYTVDRAAQDFWSVWETKAQTFKATATTAVVEFLVSYQQYDMGLDNIQVTKYRPR
jgi:hypothetical protein